MKKSICQNKKMNEKNEKNEKMSVLEIKWQKKWKKWEKWIKWKNDRSGSTEFTVILTRSVFTAVLKYIY